MNFVSKIRKKMPDIIKIDTLIGKKTIIDGDISGKGNFKIDGTVDGNITIIGDLVIGDQSVITGNVSAKNIIVAGKVAGDITAKGQLCIKSTGSINGNQACGSLIVEEGSNVTGKCDITGNEETALPKEEPKNFEETVE